MSIDYDMVFPCNHVNGEFMISNCPVCLGTAFYFDLYLQQNGEPKIVEGVNKVVQEVIHIFAHEENTFKDYGYPEYGSKLLRFVGSKNVIQLRVRFQVLRDLQYLFSIKSDQHRKFRNVDRSELITQIVAIKTANEVDLQSVELSAMIGDSKTLQVFSVRKFRF